MYTHFFIKAAFCSFSARTSIAQSFFLSLLSMTDSILLYMRNLTVGVLGGSKFAAKRSFVLHVEWKHLTDV